MQEVLVEEESKEKGIFTGRTEYNLLVHFPGNESSLANMSESIWMNAEASTIWEHWKKTNEDLSCPVRGNHELRIS